MTTPTAKQAGAQGLAKTIERSYAHFHRLLGSLLTDLSQEAGVVWIDEEGHTITPEGENNRYRKALYPLPYPEHYLQRIEELETLQAEILELQAREEPTRALLTPLVLHGVNHARLRRHTSYFSREVSRDNLLERYRQHLETSKQALRSFEHYASTDDPKREALEEEITALAEGLNRIEATDEASLRERIRRQTVIPYVYLQDGRVLRPYPRNAGLILIGPNVTISWNDSYRRERSDKVKLEPLLAVGKVEVYSEQAWREANPRR
jgi:hypothetical protein